MKKLLSWLLVLALCLSLFPGVALAEAPEDEETRAAEGGGPCDGEPADDPEDPDPADAPDDPEEDEDPSTRPGGLAQDDTAEEPGWADAPGGPENEPEALPEEPVADEPQETASGSCGDNLTWSLEDGVLTISGSGEMKGYSVAYPAPWYSYRNSITSLSIEPGVTSVGKYAFWSCNSLTSVTIPGNVTIIGDDAFARCSSLTSVTIQEGVTKIGLEAFIGCSKLANITIPGSMTTIAEYAFSECIHMQEIYIHDLAAWCGINFVGFCSNPCYPNKGKLFLDGIMLTDLIIPNGVTSIGYQAFYNCSSLSSVTIPSTVTSIGTSAFSGCSSLSSVTIPEGVTSIGYGAFRGCSSLTSVEIPAGVTSIGSEAFYGCSSLSSVTIPSTVTSIGTSAFRDCSDLTSVAIPESVTSIGSNAFSRSGLKTIFFFGPAPEISENAFGNVTATAYYPSVGWTADVRKNYGGTLTWTLGSSSVYFNANGGSVSLYYKRIMYGAPYGLLPTPERTGYTFTGWYTAAEDGDQVTAETLVKTTKSHTLYAHWTVNSYTVSFDANGGSVLTDSKSVTYDSTYGLLPTPERTGCLFDGWYTAEVGGSLITAETIVKTDEDHTLYAHWTVNVSLDANGGSVSSPDMFVTVGTPYGTLPTPSRTGYTFAGWYTAAEGGELVTAETVVQTAADHTLYAHWTVNEFTVNFNPNGGSVDPASKTVAYDAPYGELPTPTRTGYTFTGWYTSSSGGTQVTVETTVTSTSNHTLYAHWTVNQYTVSFDANGGSVELASKSVTYDSTYGTLPTPTRAGYTFIGWFTAAEGGGQITSGTRVQTAADHTLYARWSVNSYKIFFDGNGGNAHNNYTWVTFDLPYGSSLPTADRTGYTFAGWYTAAEGGEEITAETTVKTAGNHTLYAHWMANEYTVTFDPNGGSVSTTSKTVTYDAPYSELPTPTRTGYSFDGWYTAAEGGELVTGETIMQSVEDHTLYAHWTAKTYTLTLDARGGSVKPASKTVTYDEAYGTLPTPERTGYIFQGWYTAASGGEKISEDTVMQTAADHAIYAQWTIITYTITYDANGGMGAPAAQTKTYDVNLTLSGSEPTRGDTPAENYTVTLNANGGSVEPASLTAAQTLSFSFLGWNTAADGSGDSYAPGGEYSANVGATLYAQWDSSTATAPVNLPTPTREGYTFQGWATSTTAVSGITGEYTPTESQTLYAIWTKDAPLTGPKFVLDGATVVAGQEIWIPVRIENNPGLVSIEISVAYDDTLLEWTGVEPGEFGGDFDGAAGVALTWYAEDPRTDVTKDGEFVTLIFHVKDDAPVGTTQVTVRYEEDYIYNADEENQLFAVVPAELRIITYIPGDINGDGVVNNKDLIRLRRYLKYHDVAVLEAALDVNGDGVLNNKDATRLMRYLKHHDVEIH